MNFDEWYKKYWPGYRTSVTATQYSEDQHRAMIAWVAAKDFNPTNLQDLQFICDLASNYLNDNGMKEGVWLERITRYREILRDLFGKMPG